MTTLWLKITLLTDTTFGRGDGIAGWVDAEVKHDAYGMPYLNGKTVKGLLGASAAEILYGLQEAGIAAPWYDSARRLFGEPGSRWENMALLHLGQARLPSDLRQLVQKDIQRGVCSPADVLASLTALRRQTAMDTVSGAPQKESLRTMRVILRETPFISRLAFRQSDALFLTHDLAFLAACVKALRRLGTGRNRGRGRVQAELFNAEPLSAEVLSVTDMLFAPFQKEVAP